MTPLIRKEIRLLLPFFGIALVLAVVPAWVLPGGAGIPAGIGQGALWVFGFGVVLLGLAPFGQEFNLNTFPLLLAQPSERRRIWTVKTILVFAASLLVVLAFVVSVGAWCHTALTGHLEALQEQAFSLNGVRKHLPDLEASARLWYLSHFWQSSGRACLFGLVAATGGLWTTLLLRQTGAALWSAILVPGIILVGVQVGMHTFSETVQQGVAAGVLSAYSIAGFFCARRMFLSAQDAQWLGTTVSLSGVSVAKGKSQAVQTRSKRPLRALFRKEFQSHQITLLVAFGLLVFHICTLAVRGFGGVPMKSELRYALESVPFLWLLIPWLLGCVAVAEERKLGTLEGQLCQPVSRTLQFAVKLSVVLLGSIVLGGIVSWLIERAGILFHVPSAVFTESELAWGNAAVVGFCGIAAAIGVASFFASTLTRNTLHALGAAIVVILLLTVLFNRVCDLALRDQSWRAPAIFNLRGCLVFLVAGPIFAAVFLWRGFAQFKLMLVTWRTVLRSFAAILLSLLIGFSATAAIYQLPWELVIPLEPRHGPPQLTGAVTPKICFSEFNVFALLPDGRLWASTAYTNINLHFMVFEPDYEAYGGFLAPAATDSIERLRLPCPTAGTFVGGSNWTDVAGSRFGVVAIQSDGSLWKIFETQTNQQYAGNPPELKQPLRVGTETNWQSVSGSFEHFIALRKDGSIWTSGNTYDLVQSSKAPVVTYHDWVRASKNSDWVKVFASGGSFLGIRSNGTVWSWWSGSVGAAMRCGFEGTNWISLQRLPNGLLGLRSDGSAWCEGNYWRNFLGKWNFPIGRLDWRPGEKPVRLDTRSFIQIRGEMALVGLTGDGTIWENRTDKLGNPWGTKVWKPSKYSDWIAVESQRNGLFAGLAADGTLTYWRDPYSRWNGDAGRRLDNFSVFLAPSRAPTWSVNILAKLDPNAQLH